MDDNKNGRAAKSVKRVRAYKISITRIKITGIMCLVIVLAALLCISPLFDINAIVVNGNSQVTSADIMDVASVKKGDNIFALDISEICKSVEALDRVNNCYIERTLPDTVNIYVEEKNERAYVRQKDGYAGIDETGKVMVVTKTTEQKAPAVQGIKIAEAKKGDYIKSEDKNPKVKMDILLTILRELDSQGLVDDVKTIDIKNTEKISLVLISDTLVNLGKNGTENADKLEYKIAYLKAILENDEKEGGDYFKDGVVIELSDTNNVTSRVESSK